MRRRRCNASCRANASGSAAISWIAMSPSFSAFAPCRPRARAIPDSSLPRSPPPVASRHPTWWRWAHPTCEAVPARAARAGTASQVGWAHRHQVGCRLATGGGERGKLESGIARARGLHGAKALKEGDMAIQEIAALPDALARQEALQRLRRIVRDYESAITAFSGGVDSTLVAVVAQQELGERALAVTAVSPSLAPSERDETRALATALNLRHRFIETRELEDPRYAANPRDRCYFCKTHLYDALAPLAREIGARYVLNGFNLDDRGDWRPGARAS